MATKSTVKPKAPKEVEPIAFSRLKYNVEKKRDLIATHQAELVEMEYEFQLRCPHYNVERFQDKQPGDFYQQTVLVDKVRCTECGLERVVAR